jgi:hypothetical protein
MFLLLIAIEVLATHVSVAADVGERAAALHLDLQGEITAGRGHLEGVRRPAGAAPRRGGAAAGALAAEPARPSLRIRAGYAPVTHRVRERDGHGHDDGETESAAVHRQRLQSSSIEPRTNHRTNPHDGATNTRRRSVQPTELVFVDRCMRRDAS